MGTASLDIQGKVGRGGRRKEGAAPISLSSKAFASLAGPCTALRFLARHFIHTCTFLTQYYTWLPGGTEKACVGVTSSVRKNCGCRAVCSFGG